VIAHAQEPEARPVIEKKCRETGSPILWLGEDVRVEAEADRASRGFSVHTPEGEYPGLRLAALGRHQQMNAAVAIAAAERFVGQGGGSLDPDLVRKALAGTRLPGRIEVLSESPLLVVDGAHNAVAVEVLLKTVEQGLTYEDLHVLFSCSKDKDVREMITLLAPSVGRWTFTRFDFPRIEEPERLQEILEQVRPGAESRVTHSVADGLDDTRRRSGSKDCILCCGSFYLVGEIFKMIPGI
jgi:dihydrofolate synthase/folylpolyglutamate synthase